MTTFHSLQHCLLNEAVAFYPYITEKGVCSFVY